MSATLKITILIVVIMLVITGIWWIYFSGQQTKVRPLNNSPQNKNMQNAQINVDNNPTINPKDTSNAALSNDLSVIDNQMNGFNADSASVNQSLNPVSAETIGKDDSVSTIIAMADSEVSQRIQTLNTLLAKVNSMQKISTAEQDNLYSLVQIEITELTSLETKIDAENTASSAKIDYQSITKSYSAYALILTQVEIIAAADRSLTIADSINLVNGKIQSRVSGLTGVGLATINQELADSVAKVNDAQTQATLAINEVSGASSRIATITNDFTGARKDIGSIIIYLRESS